jgi:tRNA A-37 threonylcarbamoyl transferase component Bud32
VAKFGDYEILAKLGQGGMGAVYKARHSTSGRTVALKVISSAAILSETSRARFLAEARSLARFRHSNIVTLYEVSEVNRTPFLAMEFIEGRPLSEVLAERIPDTRPATTWMLTITNALAHAHAAGIIHRDLKPSNVMINHRGEAVVMDFGIAKVVDADMGMTVTGQIIGTPAFMSPEQVEGKTVDFRSDVFSLGGILYMLLTGQPPFTGPSGAAIMLKVIEEDPDPPSRLVPTVNKTLEAICLKALRKDPAERYQSAEAMCADLSAFMVGSGVMARSGHYKPVQAGLRKLRLRTAAGAVFCVLALLAAGLAARRFWIAPNAARSRIITPAPPAPVPALPAPPTTAGPAPALPEPAAGTPVHPATVASAPPSSVAAAPPKAVPTTLIQLPETAPRTVDEGDRRLRQCQFEEALTLYEAAGADAARKELARDALALRDAAAQSLTSGGLASLTLQNGERTTACSINRGSVMLADTQGSITSKAWQDLSSEDVYRIYRASLKQPSAEQYLVLGSLCQAMGLNANATASFDEAVRADPARKPNVDRVLTRPIVGGP